LLDDDQGRTTMHAKTLYEIWSCRHLDVVNDERVVVLAAL
jgi:hypothetical protein